MNPECKNNCGVRTDEPLGICRNCQNKTKGDKCDVCEGNKVVAGNECSFCNGTGKWNPIGQAFLKNHICMCIDWDRKFCPICKKRCHHNNSSQTPKQKIDPGYGGVSSSERYAEEQPDEVEEVIA